jgi:heptosyltransferase-2
VIRYRFIGDTILTVPFLRNVRRAYPHAQIDVLVGPQSGEVLAGCPYIDNLITFDTTRFHKYDLGSGKKKSFWSYVFSLRKNHYDIAFILKRSWSSALLSTLIGATHRVGYASQGRQILLTQSVPWRTDTHEVDSTLSVLEGMGITIHDRFLEAFISEEEQLQVDSFIPPTTHGRKSVLIHAAAAHPDKLYPIQSWAQIVSELHTKHGFIPFFTGATQDFELYEELQEISKVPGVNLAGKLSLRMSMALYSKLHLAICTDSGPAHLACASGIPTLSIFGPTDPIRWRPYQAMDNEEQVRKRKAHLKNSEQFASFTPSKLITNASVYDASLSCRPCNYKKTCVDRPCLTALAPSAVVSAALKLFESSSHAHERTTCIDRR